MIKQALMGAAALVLVGASASAASLPGFGNNLLGPQYVITFNPNGSIVTTNPHGYGPFDGIEDTYIGVVNNSGHTLNTLNIANVSCGFCFDGDGIGVGQSGYAGATFDGTNWLANTFSITNSNNGKVNFTGGLASGQIAYFSLEESFTLNQIGNAVGAPEPGVWAMMLLGFFGVGALLRRDRRVAA